MKLLSRLFAVFCLAAALTAPAAAAYPEKPINMVIAFTAGGSSDVQARIMQKYWNKYAPQPWVFVYKPGAGGIIGFTEIAKARPDGYTIGGLNVPHLIVQSLAQNAQYTPDSFKYICQVVNDPQCVAVPQRTAPFKTTQEIIDHARKNPGKLRVGLRRAAVRASSHVPRLAEALSRRQAHQRVLQGRGRPERGPARRRD